MKKSIALISVLLVSLTGFVSASPSSEMSAKDYYESLHSGAGNGAGKGSGSGGK